MAKLTEDQHVAVKSLATGATRHVAAKQADVSERTIYKWLNQKGFQKALDEAQASYWQATLNGVRASALRSVHYLRGVVAGDEAPDTDRIRAASTLINAAERLVRQERLDELEERIAELEQ